MARIKKIYSKDNVDEVREMLNRGYVVKGVFDTSFRELERQKLYAFVQPLDLMGITDNGEFKNVITSTHFFGLTSVNEVIDITDKILGE
jgi:hypothetical protein